VCDIFATYILIIYDVSGSHWEKRLLMNEIMTGSVDTRSVVSAMTLALLEDSGWYKANYSMADRLDWGRNQGTEFVTLPCNLWKGAYHCNNTQLSGCTHNREAEGYCPIVSYNDDLPQWARYFPQANKGVFHWFGPGVSVHSLSGDILSILVFSLGIIFYCFSCSCCTRVKRYN